MDLVRDGFGPLCLSAFHMGALPRLPWSQQRSPWSSWLFEVWICTYHFPFFGPVFRHEKPWQAIMVESSFSLDLQRRRLHSINLKQSVSRCCLWLLVDLHGSVAEEQDSLPRSRFECGECDFTETPLVVSFFALAATAAPYPFICIYNYKIVHSEKVWIVSEGYFRMSMLIYFFPY